MNEVQTWIAGHQATCDERYKEIISEIRESRELAKTLKKALRKKSTERRPQR
jgi:hypothetical protein